MCKKTPNNNSNPNIIRKQSHFGVHVQCTREINTLRCRGQIILYFKHRVTRCKVTSTIEINAADVTLWL